MVLKQKQTHLYNNFHEKTHNFLRATHAVNTWLF